MSQRRFRRGGPAILTLLVAGVLLGAPALAGCSRQSGAPRASVEACTQAGIAAIRQHVTLTVLPAACRGLTGSQVSYAMGTALHSAGIGAPGKAAERRRIGAASRYLAQLAVPAPAKRAAPQVKLPASPQIGRTALGVAALCGWLITVGIGLRLLLRWARRSWSRRAAAGLRWRLPVMNLAHLGLAVISMLIWIVYLATGAVGLAWAACVLLAAVTGAGMALVFLPPPASPAARTAAPAAAPAGGQAQGGRSRRRPPPVFAVGAHIVFAVVTILLALLAATGA